MSLTYEKYDSDGKLSYTGVDTYHFDSNNRLTKITYGDNELRNSFEYDDSQGISKNINSPFWLLRLLDEDSHLSLSTAVVNNDIYTKGVFISTNKNDFVSNIVYTYDKNGLAKTFRYTGKIFYKSVYTVNYN